MAGGWTHPQSNQDTSVIINWATHAVAIIMCA